MPGRFFRIFNCATAAIVVLAASADSAAAQDRPAAKVYVEFEGGLVGTEMAGVIDALSGGKSQILPTRLHLPTETVGLCPVLKEQLKVDPEFCTADLIAAILSLNEREGVKLNVDAVNYRTGVVLPAVNVTETDIERLYNMSRPAEANRLNDLLTNQAWSHVIRNTVDDVLAGVDAKPQGSPQITQLTIKRIAWQFDIEEPGALSEATFLARQLSSRTLSVSVERSEGFGKARHSSAPEHLEKWCGPPPLPVNAEGGYPEMAGHLYETANVVTCEDDTVRPEVAIMDQPIIFHPDLADALPAPLLAGAAPAQPPALPATCELQRFDRDRHHGTLLASIVASNENKYGFRGMAPNAKLLSFVWDSTSLQDSDLRNFIESADKPDTPQVFLFASEFVPYAAHPGPDADEFDKRIADDIWRPDGNGGWTDLLANEQVRLAGLSVREVFRRKILLVASAGQAERGFVGREIDWETPMSPQNLGDYDNVLVVGACTECDKDTAAIWPRSNRSKNNNFVSLLAPGGETVPTYVSSHQVGQTEGGTSAAAAFTAGLAAKMAACYPSAYRARAEELKERLILASRPVAGANSHWLERVAGGILDPSVSMLNPKKTWLKLNGQRPVRPVEFKHWCSERLKFRDSGRDSLNLLSMRRLTTVRSRIVGQSVEVDDDELLVKRIVHRELPGEPASPGPIAAVVYEGQNQLCAVATAEMEDLFLDRKSEMQGDCANLPICE